MFGLPKPKHPLISYIDINEMHYEPSELPAALIMDFYKIAFKTNLCGKAKYGQSYYDFGEGGLVLTSLGISLMRPTRPCIYLTRKEQL
jgi:AraC family transcriptional activator of pobA